MANFKFDKSGMDKLMKEAARNVAAHLNRVVATVAQTHTGQPVDVIKDEIRRKAKTRDFTLGDDATLTAVAEAISAGDPPPLYR